MKIHQGVKYYSQQPNPVSCDPGFLSSHPCHPDNLCFQPFPNHELQTLLMTRTSPWLGPLLLMLSWQAPAALGLGRCAPHPPPSSPRCMEPLTQQSVASAYDAALHTALTSRRWVSCCISVSLAWWSTSGSSQWPVQNFQSRKFATMPQMRCPCAMLWYHHSCMQSRNAAWLFICPGCLVWY